MYAHTYSFYFSFQGMLINFVKYSVFVFTHFVFHTSEVVKWKKSDFN